MHHARPDGVIEWVWPSSVELLGTEPKGLIGTKIADLVAPDHGGNSRREVEAVTSSGANSRLRFPNSAPMASRDGWR